VLRAHSGHKRRIGTGRERIQRSPCPLERIGEQVAIGAVDLLDRRSNERASSNRETPAAIANVA
jgi:hypothetical protein